MSCVWYWQVLLRLGAPGCSGTKSVSAARFSFSECLPLFSAAGGLALPFRCQPRLDAHRNCVSKR